MKHALYLLIFLLLPLSMVSANSRQLQYLPQGRGFVRENGWNRYTRALYGSHSNWRLETSDRPLFAAFDKGKGWNIQMALEVEGVRYPLDSTTYCRASYEGGKRGYLLRDDRWDGAEIRIEAYAECSGDNALWHFEIENMPKQWRKKANFVALRQPMASVKMKRNGDLGTDPRENFEAKSPCQPGEQQIVRWSVQSSSYLRLVDNEKLVLLDRTQGEQLLNIQERYHQELTNQLRFDTPEPLINTLAPTLMAAADGLWDGETWMHGCIGWRTPLAGWRGGYVGDITGWFDRQRSHFRAYARSMVRDIEPILPHPAQDTAMHLARSAEKWGTPMYSNGYICKLPNNDRKMSHYDMNLNYIDELLWHFQYDADTAMMREFWPTLKLHLEWEKRNWDPDGDHLYDGYCCIWASDALYYNSGAVSHASAYNYRGNLLIARIAELIGEDPTPYRQEAEAILEAMNRRLWIPQHDGADGHWAEFQDFMGLRRLHPNAALWSIYTPIDCGACSPEQAYRATRWVDACIPHIPLDIELQSTLNTQLTPDIQPTFSAQSIFGGENLFTLSTSDWMPYAWSTNNVAHEEVANMALAYFIAGRREVGYRLLYSDLIDEMCAGGCPGNFGQISHYDKALKEAYRDFGDNIGITSRAIVQGLFGIRPDALFGRCYLQPGFPQQWDHARVETPYFSYNFHRENGQDIYDIEQHFAQPLQVILRLPLGDGRFVDVKGNTDTQQRLTIATAAVPDHDQPAATPWRPTLDEHALGLDPVTPGAEASHVHLDLKDYYNASVDDIYRQEYLSPRSPYTTLELPSQGMGDWCVPLMTAQLEDDGLREAISADNTFDTRLGLRFQLPKVGPNILYTSLWDNFPDSLTICIEGQNAQPQASPRTKSRKRQQTQEPAPAHRYHYAYLLMAGSTNNMQSRIDNGLVIARYADGTADTLHLTNPYNWCPIEQDYYYDDNAYWSATQHPYRVHLGSGLVSRQLKHDLQSSGSDNGAVNIHVTDFEADTPIAKGLSIPNGAAQLLKMPLQADRELVSLTLRTLSNDVVIGLMGVTLEP